MIQGDLGPILRLVVDMEYHNRGEDWFYEGGWRGRGGEGTRALKIDIPVGEERGKVVILL